MKSFIWFILVICIYRISADTINNSLTNAIINNTYVIECTQTQVLQLYYIIQSNQANYTVEVYGLINNNLQFFDQSCGQQCTNTINQTLNNCAIKISYNGQMIISYTIIEYYAAINPPANNDTNGLSVGAIVGIVIGVVAGLALIGALIYFVFAYCAFSCCIAICCEIIDDAD